jgi:hypothetical protein
MDVISKRIGSFGNKGIKSILFSLFELMPAANKQLAVIALQANQSEALLQSIQWLS